MSKDPRFRELTLQDIEGFVARHEPETLHLEFKSVADEELGEQRTRRQLAEVLAGFANSDGGLIVWGVDARRVEKLDCAQELKPLRHPEIFASRIRSLVPDATTPVIEGVETRLVIYPDSSGFVLTNVPASDGGPHLAKFGEDRYVRRCEDRFVRMEHYEVADMFGRRRRPMLLVEHSVGFSGRWHNREIDEWRFEMTIGLRNTGRGVALAPYLAVHTYTRRAHVSQYGLTGNGHFGLPRLASAGMPGWTAFGGSMTSAIHPGTLHDVLNLEIHTEARVDDISDVLVDFRATAEGVSLQEGRLCVARDALVATLPSTESGTVP